METLTQALKRMYPFPSRPEVTSVPLVGDDIPQKNSPRVGEARALTPMSPSPAIALRTPAAPPPTVTATSASNSKSTGTMDACRAGVPCTVDLVKVDDFRNVMNVREELHRKDDDKVIVLLVKARVDMGAISKGTEMVLKVLRNRKESTEQQFRNEFQIHQECCALPHPNILYCFPVRFETMSKSHFALATEYAEEGNLTEMPAAEQLADALNVVRDIASALHHVHSCGYAHCDVKRENIVKERRRVTGADEANERYATYKLMDFGSGRRLFRKFDQSQGAGYTTSYAPPEVFVENFNTSRGKYMAREQLDVWELGITALRLCGVKPWKKAMYSCEEFRRYNDSLLRGRKPKFNFDMKQLPVKLQTIVPRMLEPNPDTRCTIQDVLRSTSDSRSTEYNVEITPAP